MTLVQPGQAPATERRGARRVAPTIFRALLELGLVAALFELYRLGRLLARGEEHAAYEHALDVHHVERFLHLPSESWIQGLVPGDTLLHLANVYYFSVHFPTMIAFLVWGYVVKPRAQYLWARNLLIMLTGSALVVHIVFPLAPPRMFPQWGFVDTMALVGPDAYAGTSGALANQFAAMPSLHVGWAALIAYVIHRTGPRWLAVVATLHLLVTMLVVVVTANHYWLDAAMALVLLAIAATVLRPPEPDPEPATT
jgi:multisubunit Na+/H+ antiporter MnhF subunit